MELTHKVGNMIARHSRAGGNSVSKTVLVTQK